MFRATAFRSVKNASKKRSMCTTKPKPEIDYKSPWEPWEPGNPKNRGRNPDSPPMTGLNVRDLLMIFMIFNHRD